MSAGNTGFEAALLVKAHELLARFGLQYDVEATYGNGASKSIPQALWFKPSAALDEGKRARFKEFAALDCFKWRSGEGEHTGLPERFQNQWALEGSRQKIFEAVEAALSHARTPKLKLVAAGAA